MRTLHLALAFVNLTALTLAQPLALHFAPSATLAAGRETTLDLFAANRGASAAAFAPPAVLPATLSIGTRSWPVELRAAATLASGAAPLAPGTFTAVAYSFTLPADATGTAIVEARLAEGTLARGLLELAPAPDTAPTRAPVGKPSTTLVRAEPAASVIQRTFANRLAPHEPIYFIYGADAPAAKFQFSFKYPLLQFTDFSNESRTLHCAFTQRSLWDITAESSPFYDTSYMPELFFESLAPRPEEEDTWFTWLGYQTGFKHESNGRDGTISRSLNTVQLRAAFALGDLEGWHMLVIPELWTYVTSLSDNEYLKDYRGYGDLHLVLGRNDGPSLMATLLAGEDFNHGSLQLDLTLPVRTKLLNFETYFLIQYFNGYGESLLHYDEKSETVRAGISLVR